MKKLSKFLNSLFFIILITIANNQICAQSDSINSFEGIWLGKLELPNNTVLRVGIVLKNEGPAYLNIIDQATGNIPIDSVLFFKDSISCKLNNLGITIEGKISSKGDTILGEFKQHGGKFTLNLFSVDKLPHLKRPQTPKEPYGYISEEVFIENKEDDVKLAGTLTLPESANKVSAVVLLTGSGQQGRNQDIAGHKPFLIISDYLSRNGIAVLRMDDRGIGGSTGNFNASTTGDFASDAIAAIDYLRNRNEINENQIGLIGHSEGGTTAIIAANKSNNVKFIISLSSPTINFGDIVINQISERLKLQNIPEETIELEMNWRRKLYEIVREPTDSTVAAEKMWNSYYKLQQDVKDKINWPENRMNYMVSQYLSPWWRFSISLDIISLYSELDCPAFLLFGGKDMQVNAHENMTLLNELINTSGKTNIKVMLIDDVNHLFQTAETGSEYEYVQIEETISPYVLNLMCEWILEREL